MKVTNKLLLYSANSRTATFTYNYTTHTYITDKTAKKCFTNTY